MDLFGTPTTSVVFVRVHGWWIQTVTYEYTMYTLLTATQCINSAFVVNGCFVTINLTFLAHEELADTTRCAGCRRV